MEALGVNTEIYLQEVISPQMLSKPLQDDAARKVIEHLKSEVDRQWSINPNRSLDLASRIVAIGEARDDARQTALGLMAKGDTLKLLGRMDEAWNLLILAGQMFKTAGDEIGWARTRIGRLFLGLKLNRVDETLADVEQARSIFIKHSEWEKLIRLEINTAYVHTQLGDQHQALLLYNSALATVETLGEAGQQHLGMLYMNIGFVYEALGDFTQAKINYEQAHSIYLARDETRNLINIELNIAYISQMQGHFRVALRLLYDILERGVSQFPLDEKAVKQDLTECYLYLNRYSDARNLARQVIDGYKNINAAYDTARTLLHLATAEAESGNFEAAKIALDEASPVFSSLGANTWMMIARLRRGQVALKQSEFSLAYQEALITANYFEAEKQLVNYATASLVIGEASLATGDLRQAEDWGNRTLSISQRFKIPSLRYEAHLLLGRVANSQAATARAIRRFQAAAASVERVERGLTITLRPEFLENKGDAWRELIGLYLRLGQVEHAFDAIERAKSQVLLSYVTNREQFLWARGDRQSQELIDELDRLRAEHQSFYRLAYNPPRNPESSNLVLPEQALVEITQREKRMRAITEQLYLRNDPGSSNNPAPIAALKDIQAVLDDQSLFIEFYNDGNSLWAFTFDRQSCRLRQLPITNTELNQLIAQLQANIGAALKVDHQSTSANKLTLLAQRILKRLFAGLIDPLELRRQDVQRLVIIPYGALHYLPFHLLFDGSKYLIEQVEIVTLPAASLATRPGPKRSTGALILSHSWDGMLPHTTTEARMVQRIFGGTLHIDEAASRSSLIVPPSQILHIAAHGQHRPDQPDLSYLELADGQLYADDLLQQDLSYEMVTLSGCETGRASVAADEELIGIGRGLLYAGAGALVLSLWQVADISTFTLMERFYSALHTGSSKAAALREAQRSFLSQDRQTHPALWGAFQLIGDASPLSRGN